MPTDRTVSNARFPTGTRRQMLTLELSRRTTVSPHLIRITAHGADLANFAYQGGDQCCRLFLPRPGQPHLRMPTLANNAWAAQYFLMPAAVRPRVRNYTVRAFRTDPFELDIDVVVHGDGPASTWARTAEIGSPLGIFDEGRMYRLRPGARWQLLVADESGLPAAVAVAEDTPPTVLTALYLETPPGDELDLDLGSHVAVTWIPRADPSTIPGRPALDTISALPTPDGPGSVFVAGERGLATGLRRALVSGGVPRSAISFFGYWQHGRATPG